MPLNRKLKLSRGTSLKSGFTVFKRIDLETSLDSICLVAECYGGHLQTKAGLEFEYYNRVGGVQHTLTVIDCC